MNRNITFVGGGNMASALVGGLISSGYPADRLTVLDPNSDQRARLSAKFGVRTTSDAAQAGSDAQVIVWAVKPQVLREAAISMRAEDSEALHISIAAGVQLTDLVTWLASDRIVRAMPNTPALVASGVTGLYAGPGVSTEDMITAEKILAAVGHVFWVHSDESMNAVTAVSGSGPAYVFYFLDAFQTAAVQLGFKPDEARRLILLVAQGAVKQALETDETLATLRERVTSKGGTTEAALRRLDQAGTDRAVVEAVKAAAHRAWELASELSG